MPTALDAQEKLQIVDRLFLVFRDRGFEGASLADLSQATGLGRSSLYHHFPRGKEQMAEAVLERGRSFIQASIAEVAESREPLKTRISKITKAFDHFYAGGCNPCVLGKLSLAEIGEGGHQVARDTFELWTTAIAQLARESGIPPARARHFAEDWIARVQGSLILNSAIGDRKPFERALAALAQIAEKKKVKTVRPRKES